jgi:hypothetical protein
MSDELRELSNKLPNHGYSIQRSDGTLLVFKETRDISIREIKNSIRELFHAGYTKLFDLELNTHSRYDIVEVSDR